MGTKNLQVIKYTKKKKNPNITLKIDIKREESKRRREEKKTFKNKSKTINKMAVRIFISVVTLNVTE